ncbi:MAG: ChaN family lipoprotein [Deltaproteobacteria bacterium]|nr:ChaN family lipoprotein [Deltaproteobacteria bacterium]
MQITRKAAAAMGLLVVTAAAAVALLIRPQGALRFRSAPGGDLDLSEVIRELAGVRVVFVGESHDSRAHHRTQLAILRALREAGVPVALGLEMFRTDAQPELDRWTAGTLSRSEFVSLFASHWDLGLWSVYSDLFDYAREQRIPLVGLNVPSETVTQVARRGFASLSAEQRRGLGTVECNVDPRYQKLLAALLGVEERSGAHFVHFCEAQLVWDVTMARGLVRYAEVHPTRTVVVLAGIFHAWKHGIPAQLARESALPYRVFLPLLNENLEDYSVALQDADYVWQLQ